MDATQNTVLKEESKPYANAVKAWLIIGLVMIFFQVVLGGITRLTGSGLSITKWDIVTGTLPPLNAEQWSTELELYKATPQYRKINEGMSLSEFKFIFFWEYIHRLWARTMGFVFIFPFLFFWRKAMLGKVLMRRLGIVVLLAAVVASFGWTMVASGLVDRPWVNAYKLTIHLALALILYSYLWWTTLNVIQPRKRAFQQETLRKWSFVIIAVLALQIILGGMMSGSKAGIFFPTWPDMNGQFVPGVVFDASQWNVENFVHYDTSPFLPALIQTLHRVVAYSLTIIVLWYFFKTLKADVPRLFNIAAYVLISVLIIQIVLGIFTVINSIGSIPLGWGVLHQAGAMLLLTVALFLNYQTRQG